ncbi:3-oxoacyl-ACP synthase III family protein [Taibaiella soli]|uniref:Ketoacyl-ACP synthase III n=1 Tax=Taibaiella soli TaxID=1649169 RepID=A0A2W2ALS1_9BACT|nr:ketoacyl-ACP synthase III [Taibaiella soli]PZF73250.1 ketoacyl-ACP synthase III [Taibaiella soli]
MFRSIITGSGAYIPTEIQSNPDFFTQPFYSNGLLLPSSSHDIVSKFKQITGIEQRRYVSQDLTAGDIGAIAARNAISDSGINPEEIDQLIVAHNFGNVAAGAIQSKAVPSLASSIKHQLGIRNPACVAYDVLFGCPGWLQGIIQADAFFKAGIANKALVIGTETLSRVSDRYDRDSMIFSDGAGAVVLEYKDTVSTDRGILSASVQTHALEENGYISMGSSDFPDSDPQVQYIKMKGRKVYEYALLNVPAAMKDCLDKSGVPIQNLKKIFIHQANEKMDEAIVQRFYQLYDLPAPVDIMPMSIHWLGNSSVATIPTLIDLVKQGQMPEHKLEEGDVILLASVGAGMNINAVCYRY